MTTAVVMQSEATKVANVVRMGRLAAPSSLATTGNDSDDDGSGQQAPLGRLPSVLQRSTVGFMNERSKR